MANRRRNPDLAIGEGRPLRFTSFDDIGRTTPSREVSTQGGHQAIMIQNQTVNHVHNINNTSNNSIHIHGSATSPSDLVEYPRIGPPTPSDSGSESGAAVGANGPNEIEEFDEDLEQLGEEEANNQDNEDEDNEDNENDANNEDSRDDGSNGSEDDGNDDDDGEDEDHEGHEEPDDENGGDEDEDEDAKPDLRRKSDSSLLHWCLWLLQWCLLVVFVVLIVLALGGIFRSYSGWRIGEFSCQEKPTHGDAIKVLFPRTPTMDADKMKMALPLDDAIQNHYLAVRDFPSIKGSKDLHLSIRKDAEDLSYKWKSTELQRTRLFKRILDNSKSYNKTRDSLNALIKSLTDVYIPLPAWSGCPGLSIPRRLEPTELRSLRDQMQRGFKITTGNLDSIHSEVSEYLDIVGEAIQILDPCASPEMLLAEHNRHNDEWAAALGRRHRSELQQWIRNVPGKFNGSAAAAAEYAAVADEYCARQKGEAPHTCELWQRARSSGSAYLQLVYVWRKLKELQLRLEKAKLGYKFALDTAVQESAVLSDDTDDATFEVSLRKPNALVWLPVLYSLEAWIEAGEEIEAFAKS